MGLIQVCRTLVNSMTVTFSTLELPPSSLNRWIKFVRGRQCSGFDLPVMNNTNVTPKLQLLEAFKVSATSFGQI